MASGAIDPNRVADVIGDMADFILEYALALVAVSVLTMALIEAFKVIFKTREKYHIASG